ncbi:MAG TPA: hypothetical protein VEU30_03100 [Thermoanaerobaculia bacterium]|nr:hypothetical protein [Thermoanaerobaculia bacterium]
MRTVRVAFLLLVSLVVASNALAAWGRAVWVHPSKNEEDFKRDYKMCEDRAAANAAHWGMAGNIFSIASDTNKCLQGEGWQKVNKAAFEKQQKTPVWVLKFDTALVGAIRAPRSAETPRKEELSAPSFEDEQVVLSGKVDPPALAVRVRNKTLSSAKLLWDEASFVDLDGTSRRIIRAGTDFNDRQRPQMPTIVAAESEVLTPFLPADWVDYVEPAKKWRRMTLVPKEQTIDASGVKLAAGLTPDQLKANVAERNVGKEYRVLLPIEIGGQIVDYTLIFRVTATDAYSVTLVEFEKMLFPFERTSL